MAKNKETLCSNDPEKTPGNLDVILAAAEKEMKRLGYEPLKGYVAYGGSGENRFKVARKEGQLYTLQIFSRTPKAEKIDGKQCTTVEGVKVYEFEKGRHSFDRIGDVALAFTTEGPGMLLAESSREKVDHNSATAKFEDAKEKFELAKASLEDEKRHEDFFRSPDGTVPDMFKSKDDTVLKAYNEAKKEYEAAKALADAEAAKPKPLRPNPKLATEDWTPKTLEMLLRETQSAAYRLRASIKALESDESTIRMARFRGSRTKMLRKSRVEFENCLRIQIAGLEKMVKPSLSAQGYTVVDVNNNYVLARKGAKMHTLKLKLTQTEGERSIQELSKNRVAFNQVLKVQEIFAEGGDSYLSLIESGAETVTPVADTSKIEAQIAGLDKKIADLKATMEGFKEIEKEFGGIPDYIKEDYDKVNQELTTLSTEHSSLKSQLKQAETEAKSQVAKVTISSEWEKTALLEMKERIGNVVSSYEHHIRFNSGQDQTSPHVKAELARARKRLAQIKAVEAAIEEKLNN